MRAPLLLGAVALLGITGAVAFAQLNQSVKEERAGQRARATYSEDAARSKALAAVPGGVIVESELEEEDGRLIYGYEIKVSGQDGVTEVEIDAVTGELIGVEQEADDDEDDDVDSEET